MYVHMFCLVAEPFKLISTLGQVPISSCRLLGYNLVKMSTYILHHKEVYLIIVEKINLNLYGYVHFDFRIISTKLCVLHHNYISLIGIVYNSNLTYSIVLKSWLSSLIFLINTHKCLFSKPIIMAPWNMYLDVHK